MTDTIITLNEQTLNNQLGELVRVSVEEMLNKMLDAETDQLTNAGKYERTEGRKDTRADHYQRKLTTKAGEVTLKVLNFDIFPLNPSLLSDTSAVRAALRKPLSRYTWWVFPFTELKILPKSSGVAKFLMVLSAR